MKIDEAAVKRCVQHLAAVKRKYPHVWEQVDRMRPLRFGRDGIAPWPRWCYMPLAGAYAIASEGKNDIPPGGVDVSVIAALAAWRPAKGIYQFDQTVFDAIWETPVNGEIPTEVLQKMPSWCCYIPFPDSRPVLGMDACGFFVHLEHDANDGRTELRFLVDYGDVHLSPIPLHLGKGGLAPSLDAMLDEARKQAKSNGFATVSYHDGQTLKRIYKPELIDEAIELTRSHCEQLAPLVSLTLYLCSTTAEIRPRDPMRGMRCKPAKTKRGIRDFGPDQPVMWEVAYRLGATLRAATEAPRSSHPGDGSHASPRAHIRRAHWHSFWTGPKAKLGKTVEGQRELILHWIPPTPVMVGEDGVIPTVHRVTK